LDTSSTIILGVVSGLLSGYLIYFFSVFLKKIALPWYKRIVYSGIDLSGTWIIESDKYDRRDITIEIKQNAGDISAISTHVLRKPAQNERSEIIRTYLLNGSLKDRFIILTGRPNDPTRIGALTFLFEVVGDGKTLKGVGSAYSSSMMIIDSRPFWARRIGESKNHNN
jgi:hypothetical protein